MTVSNAGKLRVMFLLGMTFCAYCFADTFTHLTTGEILHGYATSRLTEAAKRIVYTREKEEIELNLAEWDIVSNSRGRNNKVIVLTIEEGLSLLIETQALERALVEAADEGPLFILLEIDTPGGRVDLAQRICAAITKLSNCKVVVFVKGGKHGGAVSAGAALAFAGDKIYMSENTVIGAAKVFAVSKSGTEELNKVYGQAVGEKISAIWQAYLASLAEHNDRSGLLARAMIDSDIEVVEVVDAFGKGRRRFADPVYIKAEERIVRTWSRKGELLALTAAEAVESGIADGLVKSRIEVLRDMKAAGAEIIINDSIQKAGKEFKLARRKLESLSNSIDLKNKHLARQKERSRALGILRGFIRDYKEMIKLARRYPDLEMNIAAMEAELNSAEALYKAEKMRKY